MVGGGGHSHCSYLRASWNLPASPCCTTVLTSPPAQNALSPAPCWRRGEWQGTDERDCGLIDPQGRCMCQLSCRQAIRMGAAACLPSHAFTHPPTHHPIP